MIETISSCFPETRVGNEELAGLGDGWTAEKIFQKTGIRTRAVVAEGECASDLAFGAAEKVLTASERNEIDFLLLCTQSPDYPLPTTACLLQHRLGLRTDCGALDFNLGCSGYVYGLAVAQGLIEAAVARSILLLNADTYSRFLNAGDIATLSIFGDAGTATLIRADSKQRVHSFVLGTDGSGAENLIHRKGGGRSCLRDGQALGGAPGDEWLRMNGPEIFNFTLKRVPELVSKVLAKAKLDRDDVDYFVFHQANRFMLEHLRRKLGIPEDRFAIELESCGNTVSASIPIALEAALAAGRIQSGMKVMLVGFGVGLSWGGCILEWNR